MILLFNKDDEEDVSLSMSEGDLKEKYEGKLEKEMSGPVFETLSRIVKAVVQRKITTPGNYKSMNGTPAIACTYKSSYGLLYPLEKGFIYVHKPPVHIRFEEISSVNFARSGGSATRSFDVEVQLRNQITHVFSSIEKDEYGRLYEWVKGKKLKIGNKQRGAEETFVNEVMYDSDQEDDSGPDAYLHRVKNEAKQRDDDDDEDEDESDDDFNPDKVCGDYIRVSILDHRNPPCRLYSAILKTLNSRPLVAPTSEKNSILTTTQLRVKVKEKVAKKVAKMKRRKSTKPKLSENQVSPFR